MRKKKEVALYIPCFNAAKTILFCLDGIFKQTYPLKEVVVIDDGSTDETARIVTQYPVKLIRHMENLGLAAARNTAIKNINTEFIASLDADCIPHRNWLRQIMENFEEEVVVGIGGKLIETGDRITDIWRREHMSQNWGDRKLRNPEFLFGSNTVFKKDILLDVGLYNERYRTNYEDVDISKRIKEKGYILFYEPAAIVCHVRYDSLSSLVCNFWKWNLNFYESGDSYKDPDGLYSKIKDNIGLSNRLINKDFTTGKIYFVYYDFFLSTALTIKDVLYFYQSKHASPTNYNKKLINFIYLVEQMIFFCLKKKKFKSLLRDEYFLEQIIFAQILLIAKFLRNRFPDIDFYKVWLRDILSFYFEGTDILILFNMLAHLVELAPLGEFDEPHGEEQKEINRKISLTFLKAFESIFNISRLNNLIIESPSRNILIDSSSLDTIDTTEIKKRDTINSLLKSLKYLYEDNIKLVDDFIIESSNFNLKSEGYEQFRKDCDYYYSRVLNYPIVSPEMIQLDFMRRCQLQCRICKIWSNQATKLEEELTYEELKALFEQALYLGVSRCYFSGGEPFMLPYLFDILNFSKEKGLYSEVTTNGLLLTEENCKRLIEIPLNQLNVSIDGASSYTHDYHRNKPGLFNIIIGNLKNLVKLKKDMNSPYPIIQMVCVLTNKNFYEMLEYIKLAEKIGIKAFFQPYVSENDRYYYRTLTDEFDVPKERLPLLYKEIDRVIEYKRKFDNTDFISNTIKSLERLKEYFLGSLNPETYCFAGFNRIIILQNHKVNICPGEIGDFSKNTLRDIWFSKKAEEMRKNVLNCRKPCLMGSAYYPGPNVNNIFLITKRYIIELQKNNQINNKLIDVVIGQLIMYRIKLKEKRFSEEIEKLELILQYLNNLKK